MLYVKIYGIINACIFLFYCKIVFPYHTTKLLTSNNMFISEVVKLIFTKLFCFYLVLKAMINMISFHQNCIGYLKNLLYDLKFNDGARFCNLVRMTIYNFDILFQMGDPNMDL